MTAAYSYKHLSKVQYLRVSSDAMDNSASPGQVIHAINLLLFVCLRFPYFIVAYIFTFCLFFIRLSLFSLFFCSILSNSFSECWFLKFFLFCFSSSSFFS